jgi:hypothetical protein
MGRRRYAAKCRTVLAAECNTVDWPYKAASTKTPVFSSRMKGFCVTLGLTQQERQGTRLQKWEP